MTTLVTCAVAETLKPRLPELLQRVLDWRVQEGFNKYGQTLADNPDTLPEQFVHLAQELLDVAMYGTWIQRRPELPMQTQVAVGVWTTMAVRFLTQLLDLAPELTFEDLIRKEGHSGVPAAIQTVRELERVILGAYPVKLCYVGPVQALHLLLREREQAQARVQELEAQLATQSEALVAVREAAEGLLNSHVRYGEDPGTYLTCCSCNGFVAFPGQSGTRHATDCPALTLHAALLKAQP